MADPRNTIGGGGPPALRPITPVRSEAARAAQRAFFEAALGKTPAAAQPPAAQTPAVVKAPPPPTPATRPTSALSTLASAFGAKPSPNGGVATDGPPSRMLRPGSIIDIKV